MAMAPPFTIIKPRKTPSRLLTEAILPNSITSIGSSIFAYCTSLTNITITGSVTEIGNEAFEKCTGLTELFIPATVNVLGDWVFNACDNIKNVVFEDGENEIILGGGSITGSGVENLRIGRNISCPPAFGFVLSLKSVWITDAVTTIDEEMCALCYDLEYAYIGNNVTYIGVRAFDGCEKLKMVKLGKSVSKIDDCAFRQCTALRDIYLAPTTPPEINVLSFVKINYSDCTLHVPEAAIDGYKTASYWKSFGNFNTDFGIKLNAESTNMALGQGFKLTASTSAGQQIRPQNAQSAVRWESSNPKVAIVDDNGWVVAIGYGKC